MSKRQLQTARVRRAEVSKRRLSETEPSIETGRSLLEVEHALRERVKELECLYAISNLRELYGNSAERFLQSVVDCLPRSWQFPEYACGRIVYGERQYISERFQEGKWRMAAEVRANGKPMGAVEVFYSKGVPALPEGPFLKEEHSLLRVVAERVGSALMHMKMEIDLRDTHKVLRGQHQVLQDTNTALRTVLSRLEDEKREIRASILANIQRIIMPIVFELELVVTGRQRAYVTLLRQSLQEIASPFLTQLARDHLELTPVEIALTAMIRNGLSTKEIAQIRCIAPATVRRHRENIRRKLGLRCRKVNLVTYLQASSGEPTNPMASQQPGPEKVGLEKGLEKVSGCFYLHGNTVLGR